MSDRFASIFANFNAIQASNERQAQVEKYQNWNWVTVNRQQTNCLRSPDGWTIRHGHNGKSCNCDVRFRFTIGDGTYSGVGHLFITR